MQRKMWAENAEAYRKLANCNIVFRFQPMSTECNAWLCWSGAQTSQGGRGQCKELGAEETRNRPSVGCQRAIAHLFATLVRLNELNSFEFMNFFLQVSHSAESDWNNGRMPKNALSLARFMRFTIKSLPAFLTRPRKNNILKVTWISFNQF